MDRPHEYKVTDRTVRGYFSADVPTGKRPVSRSSTCSAHELAVLVLLPPCTENVNVLKRIKGQFFMSYNELLLSAAAKTTIAS